MEILGLGATFWISAAVLFLTFIIMFNDTLRGGVDMAGARVRDLYSRASSNLGRSTFSDNELNESEKARNIRKFRNAHVGGLYNEGNTCFMNSVIQALASCGPIIDYVDRFRDDLNFSGGLGDVINNLNQIHTRQHGYSTLRLVRLIGADRWSRYNQEDAQEFFQELLTTLEKDVRDKQAEEKPTSKPSHNGKGTSPQPRITPFDGNFAVRVGCLNCGDMEGIRCGVLSSVDLSLELNMSNVSLHKLLKNYTAMEKIPEVECYRCSLHMYQSELDKKIAEAKEKNNNVLVTAFEKRIDEVEKVLKEKVIDDIVYKNLKGPAYKVQADKTKQTMFARPNPDVLMIHINRSVFDLRSGIVRKNFASVDFPVCLDLSEFTVDPSDSSNNDPHHSMHSIASSEKDLYDLKAAVVHYGSANFGHYISFRKFHGFWWRISDDQVDLTTEAQVINAQGVFMLFYEKRGVSTHAEYPKTNLEFSDTESEDNNEKKRTEVPAVKESGVEEKHEEGDQQEEQDEQDEEAKESVINESD